MYFEFVSMHSRIPCCYFTSMPNNLAYIPILIDLIPIHVPYLDILRHLGISKYTAEAVQNTSLKGDESVKL